MIDPADLNDPAKAEAFLRETIDDLAEQIARLETEAHEQIRSYRDRHGNGEALEKYSKIVLNRLPLQIEPLRSHRDMLIKIIARAKMYELPETIFLDEAHNPKSYKP